MFGEDSARLGQVRIKICGITNARDAHAAIEAGADALGLNCYPQSRRYLNLANAVDWIATLPTNISKIAVLVNPSLAEAIAVAELPNISGLQLHGSESPAFCARLAERDVCFAKALAVTDEQSLQPAGSFSTRVIVLDARVGSSFGGTGATFPWPLARQLREARPDLRIILAGGMTPENVAAAVAEVRPFAVDVTTGVEASPGLKDHVRLRAFIAAARGL